MLIFREGIFLFRGCAHVLRIVLVVLFLSLPAVAGAQGPRPPCGTAPLPGYAEVVAPPTVGVWNEENAGSRREPMACTGWGSRRFDLVVAVAGRFRCEDSIETVLTQFGAVSHLAGVRYWSVTRKRWRDLITQAYAVNGPDGKHRRADFSIDEMKSGRNLYLKLKDGGFGAIIYRMRVRELESERLVLESENTSAVRLLAMPVFKPGNLQFVYFLDWSAPGVWGYYSLTGISSWANPLIQGHESSYINRAVAMFRHIAGIPTNQDPPAAP